MKRRGFTLIEMLLAISLLGVFMLIASRVIVANFNTQKATISANQNTARFDRAMITLRADVTTSKSFEVPGASVLRIHSADNKIVEWRIDHQTLSRSDHRSWDIGQSLKFEQDGAVILLSDGTDEIAMAGGVK